MKKNQEEPRPIWEDEILLLQVFQKPSQNLRENMKSNTLEYV